MDVTWAAERLLGGDAPVAGGAQGGGGHRERGEQVTVAGPGLPLSRLLLSLPQSLLFLILEKTKNKLIVITHPITDDKSHTPIRTCYCLTL